MNPRQFVAVALAIVLVTIFHACGGGKTSTATPTSPSSGATTNGATMFTGTIAGSDGASGAFSVTIQAAVAASSLTAVRLPSLAVLFTQVSGTLNVPGSASVALGGTYDSTMSSVNLSGGGYALTGTISSGVLSGTFTGPTGSSGGFSSLNATQASVTVYCGTYSGVNATGNPDTGVWDMQVSGSGAASGVGNRTNGPTTGPKILTGHVNGSTIVGTSSEAGSFTGTFQSGSLSGTYTGALGNGTFTGSTGTCSVPPPPPAVSNLVPFTIGIAGTSGTNPSVAASFQGVAMTSSPQSAGNPGNQYQFDLAPGTYTISGQISNPGSVSVQLIHHAPVNCNTNTCPGGVVPGSISSAIACGGPVCQQPTQQNVTSCGVAYSVQGSPGLQLNSPPSFQLQFTVDGTVASNATC